MAPLTATSSTLALDAFSARSVKISVPADAPRYVLLTGTGNLALTAASRYIPDTTRYAATATPISADQHLLYLPAGSGDTYLSITNSSADETSVTLELLDNSLRLFAADATRLNPAAAQTFLLHGTGFTPQTTVNLAHEGQSFPAIATVTFLSPTRLRVTTKDFLTSYDAITGGDTTTDSAGNTLGDSLDSTLSATQSGQTVTLPATLAVQYQLKTGAQLAARLELPSSAHEGHLATAWLVVENLSGRDLEAPFYAIAPETPARMSFDPADALFSADASSTAAVKKLELLALSPDTSAVLRAGATVRIPFYFIPTAQGYKFTLYQLTGEHLQTAPMEPFGSWENYKNAILETAARLNLRGDYEYRLDALELLAYRKAKGLGITTLAGQLRHALTGQPLAGRSIEATPRGESTPALTDANGHFQIEFLNANTPISLSASGLAALSPATVTTAADGSDTLDLVLTAIPPGEISGTLATTDTALTGQLSGYTVIATSEAGGHYETLTDATGQYRFTGVTPGTYTVSILPKGQFYATDTGTSTVTVGGEGGLFFPVLTLAKGARITGLVTDTSTQTPGAALPVYLGGEDGKIAGIAVADATGHYELSGIPAGTYVLGVASENYNSEDRIEVTVATGDDLVKNFDVQRAPGFYAANPTGYDSVTTTFVLTSDTLKNATAYAWDFDSNGTVDSTAATPTYTFATLGEHTVTLTVTDATGNTSTHIATKCVNVRKNTPLTAAEGTTVLIVKTGATVTFVSFENHVLQLSETAPTPIAQNDSIVGVDSAGNPYCVRVTSAAKNGSVWTLQTEDVSIFDVFTKGNLANLSTGLEIKPMAALSMMTSGLEKSGNPEIKSALRAARENAIATGALEIGSPAALESTVHKNLLNVSGVKVNVDLTPKIEVDGTPKFDWDEGGFDYAFYFNCTITSAFEVDISQSTGKTWSPKEEFVAFNTVLPAFPFVQLRVPVSVGAEIGIEGKTDFNYRYTKTLGRRIGCEGRIAPHLFSESEFTLNPKNTPLPIEPPQEDYSGSFEASLSARLYVSIAVEPGVFAGLWGEDLGSLSFPISLTDYIEGRLSTTIGRNPSVRATVSSGLDLTFEIQGELFGKEVSKEYDFPLWETQIATWQTATPNFEIAAQTPSLSPFGRTITFQDTSGAESGKCVWDFGGGITKETNAGGSVSNFFPPGTYVVRMKLKNVQNQFIFNIPRELTITVEGATEQKTDLEEINENKDDDRTEVDDWDGALTTLFNGVSGTAGKGANHSVKPGDWLDYRIYFTNTSSTTVQNVSISGNLDSNLDWSTFQLLDVGFDGGLHNFNGKQNGTFDIPLSGKAIRVAGSAGVSPQTGKFYWSLNSYPTVGIASGASAGFLPPGGAGYVAYRVKVKSTAINGEKISGAAEISFDGKTAIKLTPWTNTVANELLNLRPGTDGKTIAAGYSHSLYVTASGDLYAMGWNEYGQLGDGTTTDRYTPVPIATNVASVAAGHLHSFYLKTDGTLYAMGWNDYGQLGDGSTTDHDAPVKITSGVLLPSSD
jgi:uncharacterized repeat protein (TIGR01451 family)